MLLSRFIACTFSTVPIRYLSLLLRLSAAACGLTRTVFSMTHIRLAAFDCPSVWPCLTFTWICPFILLWFRAMTVETVFRPVCFLVNFLTCFVLPIRSRLSFTWASSSSETKVSTKPGLHMVKLTCHGLVPLQSMVSEHGISKQKTAVC